MRPSLRGLTRLLVAAVATVMVVGTLVVAVARTTGDDRTGAPVVADGNVGLRLDSSVATPSQTPSSTPGSVAGTSAACDSTVLGSPAAQDVEAAVKAVANQRDATIAVSWLDRQQKVVRSTGGLADVPAWSTAKVPLALAVTANGGGDALRPIISAMIRSSDNDAADILWRSLGSDDATRAESVTDVLRRAGDSSTTVPSVQIFPPYSVFGQTQWTTGAQVQFLLQLPCQVGASQVIEDMQSVDPDQRWGLGTKPDSTFKGGWGPSADGGYTVRQFGWYRDPDGDSVPVALAVHARSFEEAVATLDSLTTALG